MSSFFKLIYRLYRLLSWLRYRLERRFTRAGLVVLGGLVVSGTMGIDTENAVTYQAFALLMFLLLAAIVCTWTFKARFSATRRLPRFGTVGSPFVYPVVVRNLTARPQRGLALLEDLPDPRPRFEDWLAAQQAHDRRVRSFRISRLARGNPFKVAKVKEAALPPVPPKGEAQAHVELTPLRRGVLRFSGVTLARPDPLGLCRALARVPAPQTMLILPRRYPLPAISLPGTLKYQEGGVALAARVGESEEFVALRDYRHGDPLRHIHWRTWARVGKPVVKEFEEEFFVRHALVLDTFAEHAYSAAFEEAVAVAASFACTLPTQESLLDLLFIGSQSYCFTAGRGLAHSEQMLEVLASVQACRDSRFQTLEHLVLNHVSVVSGCICVLLAWDEDRRRFVEKLRSLGIPVLVLVVVEPGQGGSLDPGPMRAEPDKFRVLEVGQIGSGLLKLT